MSKATKVGEPPEKLGDIRVVSVKAEPYLNEHQRSDYKQWRYNLLRWCLNLGKNPEKAEGYSKHTIHSRASRISLFTRYVWDDEGRYTTNFTHDHADAYMEELAYGDTSQENKASHQKSLKMLFKWRAHVHGGELWDPDITFSSTSVNQNPRDYLTREERQKIREAALEYDSIPAYGALSPEERDRWKTYLAQRFGKKKGNVSPDDFERANSWKIPSLVWASLDAGFRPVEVGRAKLQWVDVENRVMRIPVEESSKNEDNWVVSITDRTANALRGWRHERKRHDEYEDTDALWLNQRGNPYKHYSLSYLLRNLCELANIPIENRDMTWYSIRHSVGTFMTREEGLAAAQSQLRHQSPKTTMRYDQAPPDDRRDALNRMG